MLPLVDPWPVCNSEGRSTAVVSEGTANDNSVMNIDNMYIM